MKNLLLLIISLCGATAYAQFPVTQTLGSPTTIVKSKGAFQADSLFVNAVYPDTIKANTNPYLKNYPGGQIFTTSDNTVWYRNATATGWIKYSSGGAGITPIANGGTNSSTALNNNRVMRSFGGQIVEQVPITPTRALISDGNGIPTHSNITSPELIQLSGVTGNIQTALNNRYDSLRRLPGSVQVQGQKNGVWVNAFVDSTGGGGAAAGANTEIQYNNAGAFGASNTLTYNPAPSIVSAVAKSFLVSPTLTATANGDTLRAVEIKPTYNAGVFTNVKKYAWESTGRVSYISDNDLDSNIVTYISNNRISGVGISYRGITSLGNTSISVGGLTWDPALGVATFGNNNFAYSGTLGAYYSTNSDQDMTLNYAGYLAGLSRFRGLIVANGKGSNMMQIFGSTGNMQLQNGGTFTDVASSRLTVNSATQGFLPPRMTKAQRDAIASAATGLMIFQTDSIPGLRVFNGTNWMRFTETID